MFERKKSAGKIYALPIESIQPSPFQARTNFNEQELAGLAASIRENGLLQPIAVRKKEDGYELVAGERRLRACKMAKMQTIPAILCDYADDKTAAMGLLENLQRENLNPFEQAQGLRDVMVLWDCTQAEAAKRLGMAQPTLANKLRLLQLTQDQRQFVLDNNLTERHARALLRLAAPEERLAVLEKVVRNNLNVEKTEHAVEELLGQRRKRESYRKRSKVFQNVRIFVNTITRAVETMQAAGIAADSQKIQREDYIEYRVRIPIGEKK